MYRAGKLFHGGIMANYKCTAACRHCLYASSPDRTGGYITAETAAFVCKLLRKGGCRSVHIGGGEPFLDFQGLLELIRQLKRAGIALDYMETNAFWAKDKEVTLKRLDQLLRAGGDTLCISVDPFHVEYVPLERPILLASLCQQAGMGYFLWKQQFLSALSRLNPTEPHSRKALEETLSPQYIRDVAAGYGVRYGGRAVNIEEEYGQKKQIEKLLDSRPCQSLLSTDHFHIDLYGRFIPPSCTGIVLPLEEVVEGIPDGKYPALEALLNGGIASLLELAAGLGFQPAPDGYTSRCACCFHIRHWLSRQSGFSELDREHYEASLCYYSRTDAKQ